MNLTIICPNHEGGFDCSPFCRLCEGEQEISVTADYRECIELPATWVMQLKAEPERYRGKHAKDN